MKTNITLNEARRILAKYNTDAFHLKHGETVSTVMGYFASKLDAGNETYWRVAGMLHDIDFGQYPDEHCVKGEELLRNEGAEDELIRSALSHGWGMTGSRFEPAHQMEKVLYAVDELTGLIGAAAIMRPSKSTLDLELGSVKKKFKDKRFAAGCSRETIAKGAELMGVTLDELISETILAMREYEREGKPL
jgi:putative nucleotidyltransferase with HDIG domain